MFKNLQKKFDGVTEFPVEIQDICDALVEMGYQDDIRVVERGMNTAELRGAYCQWIERPSGPYGEPQLISLVVYPSGISVEEQRVICAKELVHVCDEKVVKTNSPDELMQLAKGLCGKLSLSGISEVASIKVAKDLLAQAQAQTLLFPKAARLIARKKIVDGEMAIGDLQEMFCAPQKMLVEMLNEEWESLAEVLKEV